MVQTCGRPRRRPNNPDPEVQPDPMQQILEMLMHQQATMNNIREELREVQQRQDRLENLVRQDNEPNPPEGPPPEPSPQPEPQPQLEQQLMPVSEAWVERFSRQQPPTFKGVFNA